MSSWRDKQKGGLQGYKAEAAWIIRALVATKMRSMLTLHQETHNLGDRWWLASGSVVFKPYLTCGQGESGICQGLEELCILEAT